MKPGWWDEVRAVAVKDLRSEARTRAAVSTILLFAVSTLFIVSLTLRLTGLGLTQGLVENYAEALRGDPQAAVIRTLERGTELRQSILAALLWIVLFFSAMAGLPRSFVKERETGTVLVLRLCARPSAVFAGKLLFNALLLLAVAALVVPLYLVLLTPWIESWGGFLLTVAAGSIGMAGTATILGAMVARAGGRTYLMLPVAFPILLPILVFAINGTAAAMKGNAGNPLLGLVSYSTAMIAVSALLFEKVWSDF